ncbi:leucine-rich repeat domain-containing protein [Kitasatospora sp. NPDC127067]|uniref:leucine-rich repeat domain-containing protein n=1 Tax=Kitasatospora sp. NPDC127067 TaxID=3347126 RepID=UPI003646AFC3
MSEKSKPQVFSNRWAVAVGPDGDESPRDLCTCLERISTRPQRPTRFHRERQDTTAPGWIRLLELIEEAAADGREVFEPLVELTAEQRRQVVTLPPTIAELTSVKHLVLYGSNLVRIPPEIGAMRSLEEFTPYTSYRLHWFPYEITRCAGLRRSTVSTRAVYGNYKRRPPFPRLLATTAAQGVDFEDLDPGVWGAAVIRTCSVCDQHIEGVNLRQAWISLRTSGADVLPLLVNACSTACIDALPVPAEGYVQAPHAGGPGVEQPPAGPSPR